MTDRNDRPRQRPAVTFALILPSVSNMENKTQRHRGFCKDYSIGETIRSPSHMIIEPTSEQAIQDISLLNKHDFAFVKRSDGSHSFAILAYHSMEPTKESSKESMEECMTFVISEDGATKMVRKSRWSESIHLVFMEGFQPCSVTTTTATANSTTKTCDVPKCYEIERKNDIDWVPLSMIAVVSHMDEECSLISSVLDQARDPTRHRARY